MSRTIRLYLATSVVIGCSLVAIAANQPIIGVLSFVEIGAREGAKNEGTGREVLPNGVNNRTADEHAFVEVLYVPHWNDYLACKKSKGTDCDTNPKYAHEWSVPYITEQNSEKLEGALSRAWNRFDARTLWRMNAYINSNPDPRDGDYSYANDCGSSEVQDDFIDAWDSSTSGRVKNKEFCDDLRSDNSKAYDCKINGRIKWINWNVVQKRYDDVLKHSSETYYDIDYWKDVNAAIDAYMPGALDWDGVKDVSGPVGTAGGSTFSPVFSAQPNTAQYVKLANDAQKDDSRGYNYILQQYKGQGANRSNLKRASGDPTSPEPPGLPAIEQLKYYLASPDRDIFHDPPARKWASNTEARPTGSKGLGSLEEQQNVGHATFLRVWARKDREYSPREVHFVVKCRTQTEDYVISRKDQQGTNTTGSSNRKPNCCGPVTFEKTRAHTDWKSIPEGYQIPDVVGIPVNRDPTKSKAYLPPGK
jgi:hypothetical protein